MASKQTSKFQASITSFCGKTIKKNKHLKVYIGSHASLKVDQYTLEAILKKANNNLCISRLYFING